jgi:beta-glucosidase
METRPDTRLGPAGAIALGTATASYQVEGAYAEDGKGPSIWDEFTERPGVIADGSSGRDACDSYHRMDDDLALITGLGVDWYRFSVAWPRVLPEGVGRVEPRGLDYYDRLVDALLAHGVRPLPTLYHWDLPLALQESGGWLDRSTAAAFADYAEVVVDRLGDRVGTWATFNEPWVVAYLGYAGGIFAPGLRVGGQAHVAAHHLNLAHALAVPRLHERGVQVGTVLNLVPVRPERPAAAEVAAGVAALRNSIWLDPLVQGAYGDDVLAVAPELADESVVRPGDLEPARGTADFVGINYYTPVRPDLPRDDAPPHPELECYPGVPEFSFAVPEPTTDIGWEIDATGMTQVLEETWQRVGVPLVIAENGAAMPDDVLDEDGRIDDQDRIAYLRSHLTATRAALDAGVDVRAYFCWTLMDNFEWARGYTKRFGLVHVDRTTLDRTPKYSYDWWAAEAAALVGDGPANP